MGSRAGCRGVINSVNNLWKMSVAPEAARGDKEFSCVAHPDERKFGTGSRKFSTYSQDNPQELSTFVEIVASAGRMPRGFACRGLQAALRDVNYTRVSYQHCG